MAKFKRILIANRGEIAVRIARTCRQMGIQSVGLYTASESTLPHALHCNFGVCLEDAPLSETYLNIARLVDIAKKYQVDAVHPGYGLLSENATFANTLENAGICFIGPPASAVQTMGDKVASKVALQNLAPTIPGYHGDEQTPGQLLKHAKKIGFPVLIKAAAGGGGKGMRIVSSEQEFQEGLESAQREAKNAFGDQRVLLEKWLSHPRHIEIQVMSDTHGNHLHLFERECSIQRRYQKIVEESPAPQLTEKQRKEMAASAVSIAKHIDYVGAGTVEFILDQNGDYYFLEMNTRLQVEHPVTEMITGLDLVELQILAAQGERFSFSQKDIHQRGHAIEVRLYAENPDRQFLPTEGRIDYLGDFESLGILGARLDSGYRSGNLVGTQFDPMLAKLSVHAPDRTQAIAKTRACLNKLPFFGIQTNRDYLNRILSHPAFVGGNIDTNFVGTYQNDLGPKAPNRLQQALSLAAYSLTSPTRHLSSTKPVSGVWQNLQSFRNV